MDLQTAITGMFKHREALNTNEGLSSPTFISENIQAMAQYVGILETILAEKEEALTLNEAKRYKEYMVAGKKTSTASDLARNDYIADYAEIKKLSRYISSSWRIISTCQSRIKHLIEEARNQI